MSKKHIEAMIRGLRRKQVIITIIDWGLKHQKLFIISIVTNR